MYRRKWGEKMPSTPTQILSHLIPLKVLSSQYDAYFPDEKTEAERLSGAQGLPAGEKTRGHEDNACFTETAPEWAWQGGPLMVPWASRDALSPRSWAPDHAGSTAITCRRGSLSLR